MELQKTKHQLKLAQWRELVNECRNSGQTIKSWCAQRQIYVQTYYRWQKQVWATGTQGLALPASDAPGTFAEYTSPVRSTLTAAAVLHLACGTVEIQNGADPETIASLLTILQTLC